MCITCRLTKAGSAEEASKTLSIIENKLNYMFGYESVDVGHLLVCRTQELG